MSSPAPYRDRIPPQWGGSLTEGDYATLHASWITRKLAEQAMLRRVDAHEGRQVIGQRGNRDCAGILMPYYWPGEASPFAYRLRLDNPEMRQGKDGKAKPAGKYLGAVGGGNRLYIPPGVTPAQLLDITIPIAVVEGEKKALALWRLANDGVSTPRFIPIAISGVWSWRGTVGKTGGPKGERLDVHGPIADLSRIDWGGRAAYIVFDTNVQTNDSVEWARKGISRELGARSAEVKLVNLPEDCGVNGVDDLLAVRGPGEVLGLFESAVSGAKLQIIAPAQYRAEPDGLFRVTGQDRLTKLRLTNFQAKALANISVDDGVETTCEVEIEAELNGHSQSFTIGAAAFYSMNWVVEKLGVGAIVYPNVKEYARTAIQSLSFAAANRRLYSHTGWRKANGKDIYLHAGGAIGADGPVADVNLRLPRALKFFELRPAAGAEEVKHAVQASLRLLDLAPASISFSLFATTYLAVVKPADFSVHLTGESGGFKSELAALFQQHFGPEMHRKNLPAAWSSTGNALEMTAFHAKDALCVIDDFAPQASQTDASRLHAAAERVFRAAGNHAARGRLDSNAQLREPKPPRAMILSTGEETPRGHSIRARLFIQELKKGAIDGSDLAVCQRDAGIGLYAQSMAGFVQRLAGNYDEIVARFNSKVLDYRSQSLGGGAHARTPEIVAHVRAAFDLVLEYAEDIGAIDAADALQLAQRCVNALREAAAAQAKHQGETEPTGRFLTLLRSALFSGRAHLADREGGRPALHPESCGWRRNESGACMPVGDCVGWLDGDNLYLDLTAAYRVAQVLGRDSAEGISVAEQTLKRRLHDKRLLASVDEKRETLTIRRILAGTAKSVLHFLRTTILPEASDGDEDTE